MAKSLNADPVPFWTTGTFWSAVLMVVAYACRYFWHFTITPEEQGVIVSLLLELLTLIGMGGTVVGAFKRHKAQTE